MKILSILNKLVLLIIFTIPVGYTAATIPVPGLKCEDCRGDITSKTCSRNPPYTCYANCYSMDFGDRGANVACALAKWPDNLGHEVLKTNVSIGDFNCQFGRCDCNDSFSQSIWVDFTKKRMSCEQICRIYSNGTVIGQMCQSN